MSPSTTQYFKLSSQGSFESQTFKVKEGRYRILVEILGNDRRFALDTWGLELFRSPGDALLLEHSGWGASDQWQGELLVEDSSWNLWFRLDVGDNADWSVALRQVGKLPTPSPQPQRNPQPGATPRSTPRPTPRRPPRPPPTPQTFESCQDVPESLIVVDTQGRRAVPHDLVPSAPDGDNDGFACGGQLGLVPTPQTFRSCQEVPESLIVVDTQGRRAVPRDLVPLAPDGDNDGFACGGQLGLAQTPASNWCADVASHIRGITPLIEDLTDAETILAALDGNVQATVEASYALDQASSALLGFLESSSPDGFERANELLAEAMRLQLRAMASLRRGELDALVLMIDAFEKRDAGVYALGLATELFTIRCTN